jgi:hypothetical protein
VTTSNSGVVTRAINVGKLIIMKSLTTIFSLILPGIRNLKEASLIVIGLITIMELYRTSLA